MLMSSLHRIVLTDFYKIMHAYTYRRDLLNGANFYFLPLLVPEIQPHQLGKIPLFCYPYIFDALWSQHSYLFIGKVWANPLQKKILYNFMHFCRSCNTESAATFQS